MQLMRGEVYFNEVGNGRFVPRSVLIDLEPGVLNSVQALVDNSSVVLN